MKTSLLRSTLMAVVMVGAGLSVGVAPSALAQAQASLSAQDFDTCKQAIANLNVVEIMEFGAMRAIAENESLKGLSDAERGRLMGLIQEELAVRRDRTVTALADANCAGYTSEQFGNLLKLSKVTALKDAMWHGADPSRPAADFSQLSSEEAALIESVGNQDWFTGFLSQLDMSTAEAIMAEGLMVAFDRFQAQ